ncbi:FxSxx-COOH system tetratricopeptide repeat protein [Streptomyces malaysiensis]|uniref:FxSxx-COOH system tetratricopeptide repeat protein n=1 Tax=Streptomyces malaysiensis TaxID=92644 RepID=UPI002B2F4C79|nr:FxSxx-COOH system tetratricopeptide repeat protein [Streptomyces malaysiensis]
MEDGPVGGELVPEPGAARRIGDLKPIPEQVRPECRALAESLRELFGAVGVSLRVFAVRLHYDAGTVSRYLNGTVVPPAEFVDQLLTHAAKATGRPSSTEVMAHVHTLQRRALQATNKVGWELQRLRDQLADADRQRQQAEVRADALSEALLLRKQRIAEMEVEQRRIAVAAADREARSAELDRLRQEREDLTAERDRLREEVARLQDALTQARRQALDAERRCEALEHQLQTEEEAAGAKAAAEDPVSHRLWLAEEQAIAAEERARRLEWELAALRGGDADPPARRKATGDRSGDADPPMPRSGAGDRPRGRTPVDSGQVPAVWDGVPRRNPRFTGRDALLTEAYDRLDAAPADTAVVALVGPPGIGKSQLAAEYAHRFAAGYDVVWWSTVDGRPALEERLAALAPVLVRVLGDVGVRRDAKDADLARAALEALRRGDPYRRWLVVLDDADDPEAIVDLLPAGRGHVLITSRNRAWGTHDADLLDVRPLSREESVAFVRRRAPRLDDGAAALLAEAVEDHPLMLDQTAGWLDESTGPIGDYIEALRAGRTKDVGLKLAAAYPLAYPVVLGIQLNQLRETAPAAAELLRLCAFFAPGPVPLELLRAALLRVLSAPLAELLDDDLRWHATIGVLTQNSVARLEPGALRLPHALRQAVGASIDADDRQIYAQVVRLALREADPGTPDDPTAWPSYADLVPHLEPSGMLDGRRFEGQFTIVNALRYLALSGAYREGIRLAERAARGWAGMKAAWSFVPGRTALLRAVGEYAEAEQLDRSLLDHKKGWSRMVVTADLAADLRGLGSYEEALRHDEAVVHWLAEHPHLEDRSALRAHRSLAASLRALGRYEQAGRTDAAALARCQDTLGERHPQTLTTMTAHAWDLRLGGHHVEALWLQVRAVDRHREVLGADHPDTLAAEHLLALCELSRGDTATDRLDEALARARRLLGEHAPLTLMIASSRACAHRRYGDVEQAAAFAAAVADAYRARLGPGHPYALGTAANHACALMALGDRESAPGALEEALTKMTAAVGEDHPWTLGTAVNMAAAHQLMGHHTYACAVSREAALRAEAVLGLRHPLTLTARLALAADLWEIKGGRDEARTIRKMAIGTLEAQLGPQHPHVLAAWQRHRPVWDFEPLPV